jgi:hypothetical protein
MRGLGATLGLMMGKYTALRDHLDGSSESLEMTFVEISDLVAGLPPSAYRHSAWWSNNERGHVQAEAWLGAGRRITRLDLARERVWFSSRST